MIRQFTAFTREIDDTEAAVREILEQLMPEENKLKNTIGIVHFYHEFVDTGVCKAIVDALPFELAGCVSSYIGTRCEYDDVAMSVTMLTSDDVYFSIQIIEDVSTKTKEQVEGEVKQVLTELSKEDMPKMIIPYLNPQTHFAADDLVDICNSLQENIPLFGTIAFDMESFGKENQSKNTHYVLARKIISSDVYAFIGFYGNFEPKFHYTTAFDLDESLIEPGEITDVSGPVLHTVNGISAVEYLKKQGIIDTDNKVVSSGMWTIPAIISYPDGTKTVRAFLMIIEGTESIFASGSMNPGGKIIFSILDADKTICSTEQLMKKLIESNEKDIIAFSCAARAWALGAKYFLEAQKIAEHAQGFENQNNEPYNYCVAYSGGEICPVWDKDGRMVNTLHNYSLITCTLN
jgi:hypothetical protein